MSAVAPGSLVIAVPSATGAIAAGSVRCIVEGIQALRDAGWRVAFWPWERGAIIQHIRNEIAAAFLQTDATHLLMLDDDMEFNPQKLTGFVSRPVDVVAGMYRGRGDNGPLLWRGPRSIQHLEGNAERAKALLEAAGRDDGLIEADAAATGLMRLSRACVLRMTAASESYTHNGEECAELFAVSIGGGILRTEDFTFCRRWKELGERVWIDPDIETGHAYRELAVCALGEELRHAAG